MGEIFSDSKFWMFQKGSESVCVFVWHRMSPYQSQNLRFPGLNWRQAKILRSFLNCHAPLFKQIWIFVGVDARGLLRQKIYRDQPIRCQVQLPWGALWYSVIACVQLAVSIGLLRGPLRCNWKNVQRLWPFLRLVVVDFLFISGLWKGTSATSEGIFWVPFFLFMRKMPHM